MTSLDGVMVWVADVRATVRFYEALGLPVRWVREEGDYAQLDTGAVTLQFADERAAAATGVAIRPNRQDGPASAFQLALAVDDVPAAVDRAVAAGARVEAAPVVKPWGQTIAYVRDPDGVLVELATAGD